MTESVHDQDLTKKILGFIAEYFSVPVGTIHRETVAQDVSGWDSMANAEIIMGLEDLFDAELEVEDLLDIDDVGCMIDKFQNLISP